jgi:hypothetical protein
MNRLLFVAVVLGYVVATWLTVQVARDYYAQHPSFSTLLGWSVFYTMGVIAPWVWWIRHRRLLRGLALTDARLQSYLTAPMVAGALTFLFGLRLIIRALG